MKSTVGIGFSLCLCTLSCSSILGDFTAGPASDSGSSVTAVVDGSMGGGSDASVSDSGEVSDSGNGSVSVSATGITSYVGQMATIAASASTNPPGGAVSFTWALASAPAHSALSTSSLTGSTTASVSFVPDAPGPYSLTVSAKSSAATNMTTVTVRAVEPTLFYMQGSLVNGGPDASFTSAYFTSGADGTQAHAVTCAVTGPTTASGGLFSVAPQVEQFYPPDDFTDFWEAPPGQASRFAASVFGADPSGNPILFSGLEDASCASPATLIYYDGGSAQPRFTADGSRLVFFGLADLNIVTVNPDGSDLRIVANYAAGTYDAGLAYDTSQSSTTAPPRPQWMGNVVTWVRQYTPSSSASPAWEIVKAEDVVGAMPQRYMACPGGTPREYQFLADGTVIVAYRTTASTGPENLYRLAPDSSQNCTILEQYTDLGNSMLSEAADFAISPDQTKIAFVQFDGVTDDAGYVTGGLPGGYPYVVGVDGGTPVRLSNDFLMFGPRWIGDGTRLVATRYDGPTDGGIVAVATSLIVRAPMAGPSPAPVVTADGYTGFLTSGSNGGCSASPRDASPATGLTALLGAAVVGVLRRRRRA